jgi:hypothetical protein
MYCSLFNTISPEFLPNELFSLGCLHSGLQDRKEGLVRRQRSRGHSDEVLGVRCDQCIAERTKAAWSVAG